jgi:hypothetical protein
LKQAKPLHPKTEHKGGKPDADERCEAGPKYVLIPSHRKIELSGLQDTGKKQGFGQELLALLVFVFVGGC